MSRGALAMIAAGLGFSVAVLGFAALASEMGDPWGVFVLLALAPGMPFLGNRGDSHLPALVACVVAWAAVGALVWAAIVSPILARKKHELRR